MALPSGESALAIALALADNVSARAGAFATRSAHVTCFDCAQPLPEGAVFCSRCGKRQRAGGYAPEVHLRDLVARLPREGWTPIEMGAEWYNHRFERRLQARNDPTPP